MIDYQLKFILIFLASFIVSLVLTKLVIKIARRFNILDNPELAERKIHQRSIPLLGGAAIYATLLIIIIYLWSQGQLLDDRMSASLIVSFLLAGFVLLVNGFLDDKYSWPAKYTIWGPIIAAIIMLIGGLKIGYITNWQGGVLYLDQLFGSFINLSNILIALLTFVWLLGMTYTTKFLDGIDGLASGIGLIASLVIFIVSLSWDVVGSTTSLLALALAGACLGFLVWNWHPAKIFLGESGSTLIGFTLGVLAVISGSKIATALLVMGLPILDALWVIIWRLKRRQPIWRGDSQHLHFRLLSVGLSQRQVVLFIGFVSLLFGLVSIFFTTKAKLSALIFLFILMFILTGWLKFKLKSNEQVN
ncbi:undecaprenyl/decaprenyl-phosphate alpha-N-acetylglucosaminyl 1-phosphate transferase [bacterium]|jgi:UDP-GlcNAc:undecaprenyl-phosphate/decaprenyl-phosphate GlcNAc-1-phosphate transferase|nr:undecaprenyl/decaprenyl-phosphate alpha-N-acetylglucosaminyl 1-phosphate transferase [bacterium]MBT4649507.1 undecaprenyl/decaprenyl-phosphate alpha-N-acetylglucosaminyl 1-phosphate transferase [bacterium]